MLGMSVVIVCLGIGWGQLGIRKTGVWPRTSSRFRSFGVPGPQKYVK